MKQLQHLEVSFTEEASEMIIQYTVSNVLLKEKRITLFIYDSQNRLIYLQNFTLLRKLTIPIAALTSGTYNYRVSSRSGLQASGAIQISR